MILKGTPATISVTYFDGDEIAEPGAVTVTVTRADGTELVAETAADGSGAAARTFDLTTTHTGQVDVLTATWVSATLGTGVTYHPIVGGFYVDLATLRAEPDIADETRFSDADLADARQWWSDVVDDYCDQSFVPRFRLETHYRTGGRIWLERSHPREILSVTVDGGDVDFSDWTPTPTGRVITPSGVAAGLLRVGYEHGHDQPDRELYEVGITAMRSKLLTDRSGRASRQTLITNALGTVRLSQPGPGRATGLPDVDAVLNRRKAGPILV